MRILKNDNLIDSQYIDLDEQSVMIKALELYRNANMSYTNAYGLDKIENSNYIVTIRLLDKLTKLID